MRITFILPVAGLNGGTRVIAIYARQLMARGHEVFIVSQPWNGSKGLRAILKRAIRKSCANPPDASSLLGFLGSRHKILDRQRPPVAADMPDADIIVATWWETAEWVAALPPEKGRKHYFLQDYEVFPYLPVDRVAATFDLPLTKIAVSHYIRTELARNHDARDVHVVPNAVDLVQFSGEPRSKSKQTTVGFLYTSTPRKNVSLAIDAINLAKMRLPGLRAQVFGANPPDVALPLPEWVSYHVAPPQVEIPRIYAACDAWLFTSEKEGFGLPILEAMACRTPVLATRAGAAPDLIDGTNGTLLSSIPEAFADEILRFVQMSQEEWLAYSGAAHRTATGYTWQDATDRLLEIFSRPEPAFDRGYGPKQAAS